MPPRIPTKTKNRFFQLYRQGWPIAEAARECGVSYGWAKAAAKAAPRNGQEYNAEGKPEPKGPVSLGSLEGPAARALEDIVFFGERYFGTIVMPWQEIATARIVELEATSEEEYAVINCPPGSGKSTFFTLVLPAWLTVRRRHIRGLIGSASMNMAKQYLGELRDVLESPEPFHQDPEAIDGLYAVRPVGCLAADFGRFKPESGRWASDAFIVEQHGGARYRAKEPSWQAFGRGSRFLGTRIRFAVWDDVWDDDEMRTEDSRQQLRDFWVKKAESRIEPGGLLVLQGQRMDPEDIYRFALDRRKVVFDDRGDVVSEAPKYHHIVFPAHDEHGCKGPEFHRRSSRPWDGTPGGGCLLFPRRLTWQKLSTVERNDPESYAILYQQGDSPKGGFLVDKLWVVGGRGPDGVEYPGCWDEDRGVAELPRGLTPPLVSVVTADPSPTKYWAIQWWVYHPETEQRFLMDLERRVMGANDFLDYVVAAAAYTGLMPEWQRRSVDVGAPISHWIVEQNAAQRFMLQYDQVKNWLRVNQVSLVGHETQRNKADPDLGVTSTGSHWMYGRVRLPGRGDARVRSLKLVHEATRYRKDGKTSGTTDQVMAHWFLEWNLPNLAVPASDSDEEWRPSWAA